MGENLDDQRIVPEDSSHSILVSDWVPNPQRPHRMPPTGILVDAAGLAAVEQWLNSLETSLSP